MTYPKTKFKTDLARLTIYCFKHREFVLFILADQGMGKTSSLAIVALDWADDSGETFHLSFSR